MRCEVFQLVSFIVHYAEVVFKSSKKQENAHGEQNN